MEEEFDEISIIEYKENLEEIRSVYHLIGQLDKEYYSKKRHTEPFLFASLSSFLIQTTRMRTEKYKIEYVGSLRELEITKFLKLIKPLVAE